MLWLLHNKFLVYILFAGAIQNSYSQNYSISNLHSKIEFEIGHLGVLTVSGNFSDFAGTIKVEKSNVFVGGIIKTFSVSTDNTERDKTIKSEPYLNVSRYPEIKFVGNGTQNKESISLKGQLSIKGVSKDLELKFDKNEDGTEIICTTAIVRRDFNLTFGTMDALIGEEVLVRLTFTLEPMK